MLSLFFILSLLHVQLNSVEPIINTFFLCFIGEIHQYHCFYYWILRRWSNGLNIHTSAWFAASVVIWIFHQSQMAHVCATVDVGLYARDGSSPMGRNVDSESHWKGHNSVWDKKKFFLFSFLKFVMCWVWRNDISFRSLLINLPNDFSIYWKFRSRFFGTCVQCFGK